MYILYVHYMHVHVHVHTASFSFLKAVSSFTISFSFPIMLVCYTHIFHVHVHVHVMHCPLQLIQGLRKSSNLHVPYLGDPLLQPIRSYENAALVRCLHSLSTHLNDKVGSLSAHCWCMVYTFYLQVILTMYTSVSVFSFYCTNVHCTNTCIYMCTFLLLRRDTYSKPMYIMYMYMYIMYMYMYMYIYTHPCTAYTCTSIYMYITVYCFFLLS